MTSEVIKKKIVIEIQNTHRFFTLDFELDSTSSEYQIVFVFDYWYYQTVKIENYKL